ncbi:MAG: Colicin receptor precursor [Verrucomicrobiota bacterium]
MGQESGRIVGRVIDEDTGRALGGALVRVADSPLFTYSDAGGEYRLAGVSVGSRSLEFSYLGYRPLMLSAEVRADETVRLDALFTQAQAELGEEVFELDQFVVEGSLVGAARAINQQRAADTYTNIVAADDIGRFPDQNAAESLSRLPGLSVYRDQGEGRFVVVRGVNFTLGNVTLDGVGIASPESGQRGVPLDVVGSDSLAAIEVVKVPTPDKTPEGLGGSINLRGRSPFDADNNEGELTTQGIYSKLTGEMGYKLNGNATFLFNDKTVGLMIGFSQQQRNFGSYNYETDDGWFTEDFENGGDLSHPAVSGIQFRDYVIERERRSVNAALELRPDDRNSYWVRGSFSKFDDIEQRHTLLVPLYADDGETLVNVGSGTGAVEDVRRAARRGRYREKLQDLVAISAGSEHRLDRWTIDTAFGYSKGEESKPGEFQARFRRNGRDLGFSYDIDGYDISITQTAGPSIEEPATFTHFQRIDSEIEKASETESNMAINARLDLRTPNPAYVKFGGSYRMKNKDRDADVSEWTGGPSDYRFANYVGSVSDYPYGFATPTMEVIAARDYFNANRGEFEEEVILDDTYLGDWDVDEDILAAYVLGGLTLGKADWLAGVRYERTEVTSTGSALELDDGGDFAGVTARSVDRDYDMLLPGLHLRFAQSDELILRASISNSIVRPAYEEIANARFVDQEDLEVEDGNPALEALRSFNLDASIEYYLPNLGMLSAAVFHKDIRDFTFLNDVPEGIQIDGVQYDYARFENGNDGKVYGVELAYQQQLRFLPGFGVLANLTLSDSSADYGSAGEFAFVGQADYVGNLALTYESDKFFTRLSANFRGERLREDEAIQDGFYVDSSVQLDWTASYRLSSALRFFVEVNNLTNEPFRVFTKGPSGEKLLQQFEEYDWSANFGIRWAF